MIATADSFIVKALVVAEEGGFAEIEIKQGCGRCHESGGCGGTHLTQIFHREKKIGMVDNAIGAKVGETVEIAIKKKSLHRAVGLAYIFPLSLVLIGAVLGQLVGGNVFAIVFSLAALFLSAAILYAKMKSTAARNPIDHPHIISRCLKETCETDLCEKP